ncbi:MAG: hypothetical protein QOE55_6226, partial [Acidobacteriaceae bacterium]|nr:hypothetical protein [Acidobacteriaceae bacterium]
MADETNNPGGPTNPFSSTGPQGPARTTPPSPNVDQLRSAVDALTEGAPALREIAALVSSITAKLEKSEKSADGITKRYREHGNELRQIVAFEDDIEE